MKTIKELAIEHKCDKAAEGHHTYDKPYEFHFAPLRGKEIKLLEIGVGGYDTPNEGGASLRMWAEYFTHPFSQIFSIDIYDKKALEEDRIKIWQGSQSDEAFLNKIADTINGIDIIIDDGSHVNSDVIKSFFVLFPKLNDGGIYVVEDIQTAYWKHYGGGGEDNSVNYFKQYIDGLNYKEIATEMRGLQIAPDIPHYFDLNILSIHFYHNMVFIYKGDNSVTA